MAIPDPAIAETLAKVRAQELNAKYGAEFDRPISLIGGLWVNEMPCGCPCVLLHRRPPSDDFRTMGGDLFECRRHRVVVTRADIWPSIASSFGIERNLIFHGVLEGR